MPLALSEIERWQCAAPSLDWSSSELGHTLPHCSMLLMQLLLQPLIPGPVLSQPLLSGPVRGGGVDSAGTGMGWMAAAAAAVDGFVLTAQLSGLWCSLAVVFGE